MSVTQQMAGTEYGRGERELYLEWMHEIIFQSSRDTISVDGSTADFILECLIKKRPKHLPSYHMHQTI